MVRRALAFGAFFTLAGSALWSLLRVTLPAASPLVFSPQLDCAAREMARFARAQPLLPKRGVIGYLGAQDLQDDCNAKQAAQHALAPVLLVELGDRDWIERVAPLDFVTPPKLALAVVDLRFEPARAWLNGQREYRIVADAGDDIVLIAAVE